MKRINLAIIALVAASALVGFAAASAPIVLPGAPIGQASTTSCDPNAGAATAAAACDDSNACTVDTCIFDELDPTNATGICSNVVTVGATCDDGDLCTTGETCSVDGVCTAGTQLDCSGDEDQCNTATCSAGQCVKAPKTGSTCDDGDACSIGDTCSAAGICTAGAPKDCSAETDLCNTGTCSAGTCTKLPKTGASCDDGDKCNLGKTCSAAGTCSGGTAKSCPNDVCNSNGACSAATGECTYTQLLSQPCDRDNSACTLDTCAAGATKATCQAGPAALTLAPKALTPFATAKPGCSAAVAPAALVTATASSAATGAVSLAAQPLSPYYKGSTAVTVTGFVPVTYGGRSDVCSATATNTVLVQDTEGLDASKLSCGLPEGFDSITTVIAPKGASFTATYKAKDNGCAVTVTPKLTVCRKCAGKTAKTCNPKAVVTGPTLLITDSTGVDARITWRIAASDGVRTVSKDCGACVGQPGGGKVKTLVCASPWKAATEPVCGVKGKSLRALLH